MCLNAESLRSYKFVFFDCVVISDLYGFQEIALLDPCYKFYQSLTSSLIDKVTTNKAKK